MKPKKGLQQQKSKLVVLKVFRHNLKRQMMQTVFVKSKVPQMNSFSKIEG